MNSKPQISEEGIYIHFLIEGVEIWTKGSWTIENSEILHIDNRE